MKKNNTILIMKVLNYLILFIIVGCNTNKSKISNKVSDIEIYSNKIVDTFFTNLKVGDYNKALINLVTQNNNIDLQDSGTLLLIDRFKIINTQSGQFMSSRQLRKKSLENDLVVYTYLVKYSNKFYRFNFVFYNNSESTKIYRFSFDDHIDVELEEAIKLYIDQP
jgi:hypothetical protein